MPSSSSLAVLLLRTTIICLILVLSAGMHSNSNILLFQLQLQASAQIAGTSVDGEAADTLAFLPTNASTMKCDEYNPCLSGMVCCNVPDWYKEELNARILLLKVVTNNSDGIAHGGTNITAPNETITWLGKPPPNESVYCCFSTEVCSEDFFCEPESEPSDIGGGSMMVAVVVIVCLIVSGLVIIICYLMPTEPHIQILNNKRKKQAEVLAQFNPRVAPEKKDVGWLDLY